MNDDPTTINVIINKLGEFVDIIIDISTGPETKRIGCARFYRHDISMAIGSDWEEWIHEDRERFIRQFANLRAQLKHPLLFRSNNDEERINLLSRLLWQHDRPPAFNEWEKAKLMQDLQ